MRAEETPGPTIIRRRDILRGGAAAGLIWSAPTVRHAQVRASDGSPPPASTTTLPTTTTTPREPVTYEFAGEFGGVDIHQVPAPPIPFQCQDNILFRRWFQFLADLGPLGLSGVTVVYCLRPINSFVFEVAGGGFQLTNADGSFSARGTLTGTFETNVSRFSQVLHVEIDVTTGTGLFAGASGTAVVDAIGDSFSPGIFSRGTITGSVTVP